MRLLPLTLSLFLALSAQTGLFACTNPLDTTPPAPTLTSVGIVSPRTVTLRFSRPMTPDTAAILHPNPGILASRYDTADARLLHITLSAPLDSTRPTTISLTDLYTSDGHPLPDTLISVARPCTPLYHDLLINEIMPYVDSTQSKFVELYNNTDYYIDLSTLILCNPDPDGNLLHPRRLATRSTLAPPRTLIVVAPRLPLLHTALGTNPATTYLHIPLPSFAADHGHIAIADTTQRIIDQVRYTRQMHHPSLRDLHNVSLERISTTIPATETANWHSASTTAGYNTAGWHNSQSALPSDPHTATPRFTCPTPHFTPDADGIRDHLDIHYTMPDHGYLLTADIYTRSGTHVARIIDRHLLSRRGTYTWHGTDIDGTPVPAGLYIITLHTLSPTGATATHRLTAIKL